MEIHQICFHSKLKVFICQVDWFQRQVHCYLPGFLIWAGRSQNTCMASALHLSIEILSSRVWGGDKGTGLEGGEPELVFWNTWPYLLMKIKAPRSFLEGCSSNSLPVFLSCSLLLFAWSLTTWFLWNQKSSNTTEESELRLWHPWLSQTPETVEISTASPSLRFGLIARPKRLGVTVGSQAEPLQALCLLFSHLSATLIWRANSFFFSEPLRKYTSNNPKAPTLQGVKYYTNSSSYPLRDIKVQSYPVYIWDSAFVKDP